MLRTLCWCCWPPADDRRRLVDESTGDDRPYQQDEGYASSVGGNTPGGAGSAEQSRRSAADEEQDILRRILAQTEANIIDVSSAHGGERARHAEFVAKIERYQGMLARAAQANRTRAGAPQAATRCTLLRDQLSVTEALSRPPPLAEDVEQARRTADAMDRAARRGIRVEHKDELIVHMAH